MRWQLKPESEKMLHLDCLRLIAATGIVLLHGVGRLEGLQLDLGSFRLFVDLFFVISGYVIWSVYMDGMCDREAYKGFLWSVWPVWSRPIGPPSPCSWFWAFS